DHHGFLSGRDLHRRAARPRDRRDCRQCQVRRADRRRGQARHLALRRQQSGGFITKQGLGLLLAFALIAAPASAAMVPALTAFDEVLAHVNDYTVTVHSHEVKNGQSQDRVYQFWYKKPHQIKTQIISGPGTGGGAVWTGG